LFNKKNAWIWPYYFLNCISLVLKKKLRIKYSYIPSRRLLWETTPVYIERNV